MISHFEHLLSAIFFPSSTFVFRHLSCSGAKLVHPLWDWAQLPLQPPLGALAPLQALLEPQPLPLLLEVATPVALPTHPTPHLELVATQQQEHLEPAQVSEEDLERVQLSEQQARLLGAKGTNIE